MFITSSFSLSLSLSLLNFHFLFSLSIEKVDFFFFWYLNCSLKGFNHGCYRVADGEGVMVVVSGLNFNRVQGFAYVSHYTDPRILTG